MIQNKMIIEGTVVHVGDWNETKRGDLIRDIFVDAEGNRMQHYCLTQYCNKDQKPWELSVGEYYRFEGYTNGLKFKTEQSEYHVNKICISRLWKPALP